MTPALEAALEQLAGCSLRLLFFDFDGTLSPLVDHPEDAVPDSGVLALLKALAHRPGTRVAVVTGRSLEDIRSRLPVDDLTIAAAHGFVIQGAGLSWIHPEAAGFEPLVQQAARSLERACAGIRGVHIENKRYSVAVHYRRASSEDARRVLEPARRIALATKGLRALEGKKVLEIRPDIDWDKGKAVELIIERLAGSEDAGLLYVGDDRTDEDAFRQLKGRAVTVRVGRDQPTEADFCVEGQAEVTKLLSRLARLP